MQDQKKRSKKTEGELGAGVDRVKKRVSCKKTDSNCCYVRDREKEGGQKRKWRSREAHPSINKRAGHWVVNLPVMSMVQVMPQWGHLCWMLF